MKFYNPFKPHVWQSPNTGYWYIRKSDFPYGWLYLTADAESGNSWWSIPYHVRDWATFNTEVQALTRLAQYDDLQVI